MTTMATEARRYGIYVIASNTQARFRLSRDPSAIAALADPGLARPRSVYAPTAGVAYDQTFVWGPRVLHPGRPAPTANLIADNYKVPLTGFEQALGFASGPSRGAAARANLRPIRIPGTKARLGIATSLPAFEYGPAVSAGACDDVAVTYMRCLNRARRQRADPGRRQRRPVDGHGRRRAVAAAVLDGLGLPGRQRSQRPLHLRCQPVHGRQPGRYAVRRTERDPSARAAWAAAARTSATSVSSPGRTCRAIAVTRAPSRSSWRWHRGWPTVRARDCGASASRWPPAVAA